MWIAILGSLFAAFACGLIYISFRAAQFDFVKKLAGGRKAVGRGLCFAVFGTLAAVLWRLWNLMNAMVCFVHLMVFWAACDLVSFLASKLRRREPERYRAGAAAVVLCVIYLAAGWYAAHHVWVKTYDLETDKIQGDLRIVQITDSHVGTTFHAETLAGYADEINALAPDAVAVTGDFVDDGTSREDMLGACRALGKLRAKYGVFFVFGNHDRGYYREETRGWTYAELRTALRENGVVLLEDDAVLVDGGFYIAGRQDRSVLQRGGSRKSAEELLSGLDRSRYVILLDHQPSDFDAEAAAGADLVLCGHTHGGQFLPILRAGEWLGENCFTYGHERRLGTDFIVSSGISDWTLRFRTGCRSEYVVVNVKGR